MKKSPRSNFNQVEYVTAGRRKFNYNSFYKKDTIIRNAEIACAVAIVLIAGMGIYGIFN